MAKITRSGDRDGFCFCYKLNGVILQNVRFPCREKRRRITLLDYFYIGRQDTTCTLGDVATSGLTVLTWVMDILFEYINISYLQLSKTSFEWDISFVQLGLRKSFKMCILTCTFTTDINTKRCKKKITHAFFY